MGQVDRILTPRTRLELARDIRQGHIEAFGGPPSLSRWAGIYGHLALEHGHGAKLFNYDFGNVTAGGDWFSSGGDFVELRVPPPDPPVLRFRSYPDAVAGMRGYLRIMAGRYRLALDCWERGHYADGVLELKRRGYMTASLEPYSRAVVSIANWAALNLLPPLVVEGDRPAIQCDGACYDGDPLSQLSADDVAAVLVGLAGDLRAEGWEAIDDMRRDGRETIPD